MHVLALYAATPQPFGPRGAPSSIIKSPVPFLSVSKNGTEQDEQGNKKLHGGPEKVLHQYSLKNYELLRARYPDNTFEAGSIGENMLVEGMEDDTVFIGDIWQFGEVILQVSAPRAPCNKISHRYQIKNLDRFVGEHGATGWYYRVLQTGTLRVNDDVRLLERADITVSVRDLMQCTYNKTDTDAARAYAILPVLDDEWRIKCEKVATKS